jgi:hypothetical protein
MYGLNLLAALMLAIPVSDVQLDQELKSVHQGNCSIEIISKVTKTGDTYTYLYSIKNKGKQDVKFKWNVLNKAMQYGADIDMVIELKPGENLNFVLEHPDEPAYFWGMATSYYTLSKEDFDKLLSRTPNLPKGVKMQMPKRSVELAESMGASSVLPKTYVNPTPFFHRN